jgi:pyridoxal phosphate enzyme (YggS family)
VSLLGDVAERLHGVRQKIADAGGADVEIVAVTKGHPVDVIDAAIFVGLHAIGENYAQELLLKLSDRPIDASVHFIGQLQTNKVRLIAHRVDVFETLDRPALAVELAKRAAGARVLVQVNATGESVKGGCAPDDAPKLVEQALALGLSVEGLMTVGPTVGGAEAARPAFRLVRRLCDTLRLATCSMGMSDDFVVAVQEGANQLRLGSALFGMRPLSAPQVR